MSRRPPARPAIDENSLFMRFQIDDDLYTGHSMWIIEDRLLVWNFNRGDPGAMRRIYEKHRASLLGVAGGLLRDRSLAEDVVHDVFVNFASAAGQFELRSSLKAYLAVCVANRARDVNRRQALRAAEPTDEEDPPASLPDPEAQTMSQETSAAIDRALATLPDEQREIVVLRLHCGLPFREIAGLRGIPVNTATSRYRYAVEKLRTAMNGSYQHA